MREDMEENPWGIKFCRLLDMSNDSRLFLTELEKDVLPLYEGKMAGTDFLCTGTCRKEWKEIQNV